MIVTSVTYSELVSGENFSNRTIGATAKVNHDERAEESLEQLRTWVRAQHSALDHKREQDRKEQRQRDGLRVKMSDLQDQLHELEVRYDKAREFLKECGIPVPEPWTRDVPF